LNITLRFIHEASLAELDSTNAKQIEKLDRERGTGIYFFAYGGSSIPYYIGASPKMFTRACGHATDYKNKKLWTPRSPEKLAHLSCFWEKITADAFFGPGYDNFHAQEYEEACVKIFSNTKILFAQLEPDIFLQEETIGKLIYNVKMQLNNNLMARMGLIRSWVGDAGVSYDIWRSLKIGGGSDELGEPMRLSFRYEIEPAQRLNETLLL